MDYRVKYPRQTICDNFLALLKKREIDKITVTEICQLSHINRATFYRHYDDIYDLVEKILNKHLEKVFEKLSDNTLSMDLKIEWLFRAIYEHRELWILISKQKSLEYVSTNIFKQFAQYQPNANQTMIEYYFFFYGIDGIFKYWLNNNFTESPKEISNYAVDMFHRVYGNK